MTTCPPRPRVRCSVAACALLAGTALRTQAQICIEPPNETCDRAIEVLFDELPRSFDGQLGCTNDVIDRPYFDVFFIYHCTRSGEYVMDLCDSVGDTYLKIYDDECTRRGHVLAEDDDSCLGSPPSADPMLSVDLLAGVTYWIEVGSWRPDPPFAPPPNAAYTLNVSYLGITCPGDTNGDSLINLSDLAKLLSNFGIPGGAAPHDGDVDGDGNVDLDDLGELLKLFDMNCLAL